MFNINFSTYSINTAFDYKNLIEACNLLLKD